MNAYTELNARIWLVFALVQDRYTVIQLDATHLAQT
jgi:hypothetical protein